MAYKAEINVDVRNLNKVSELEAKLSNISRSVNTLNRGAGGGRGGRRGGGGGGGSEAEPLKEELALLKLQNTALGQSNRAIRAKNKLKGKNLELEDAISKLENIGRGKDTRDIDLLRREVEERKKIVIEAEKTLAATVKTSEARSKIKPVSTELTAGDRVGLLGLSGKANRLAGKAEGVISADKQKAINARLLPSTEMLRPAVRGIKELDKNVRNLGKVSKITGKNVQFLASQYGPQEPGIFQPPQGPFSRLSDRQSRDVTGRRTRLNNPIGGIASRLGATRGFDAGSALISGGFPLLFGQGPAVAAAGALGGGIGGMFGQMGGFAGGIAATAAVQAIQSALDEISKLGQAMGSFTQDTQAMITAMGLQGSAQEAQLKRIERTQGKTAAFNASMKMMENRIGTSGVRKIKEFGETTRVLGTIFSTTLLRLQAFMGGMANFIARLLAGEKQLKDAEVNQTIKDAAAGGNIEAQKLLDREREIEETGFDIKGRNRTKVAKFGTKEKLEELDRDKELFAVRQKVSLSNDEILSKSQDLVKTKTEELDLQNRIKEEMAKGTNKELATSLAKINQIFDKEQEILQSKVDQSNLDIKNAEKDGITGDKLQRIKDIHEANTQELEKHNKLRGEAIKLEKDLALATDSLKTNFEIIGESIASGVSDNLTAAIQGTKTLGDAAKSILNDLSSSLIRLGVNTLLSKIPGFGGLPILGTRSKGGPVRTGGSFVVGEKGPELFVPKRSGTIIPNDKLAGGGNTNISVNIDASGSSVQGNEQQGKELGRVISAAIQSELIKQRRPGGLLR